MQLAIWWIWGWGIAHGAILQGGVNYNGETVPVRQLAVGADPLCSRKQVQGTLSFSPLTVTDKGGVVGAFVYVKGDVEKTPVPREPAVVTIRGCQILPRVMGVRAGQPVEIRNEDEQLHTFSVATQGQPPLSRGVRSRSSHTFTVSKAEVGIPMSCALHGWARAYLNVVDHDYFAITDDEGRYELPDLETGDYVVEAWHPVLGALSHEVRVGNEEKKNVSFTFLKSLAP